MKKVVFSLTFASLLLAQSSTQLPMPPMPPTMNIQNSGKKSLPQKPSSKKNNTMPKECEIIPPMLIFMPPPLEKDLRKCKNRIYQPKKNIAQKQLAKLLKKKIQVVSIKPVDGFSQVYEIDTPKEKYYCNKDITKCFQVK